jgi:RNA polymerase sigma-70 factor (ECF subfamily)
MALEMTGTKIEGARSGDRGGDQRTSEEFTGLADPYRRELFAHCYRMVGSVHDAEDLVQETYLRAWRAYHGFEGRASLRTWLYKIATNVCLTSLEGRERRPLPTGLGGPSTTAGEPLVTADEVLWLEPVPDSMITDPAEQAAARDTIRLAFVAALQHLPPRQRAVLILRDVLKWQAAEVAEALEISTAAVNSVLQRAHAQMAKAQPSADSTDGAVAEEHKELLEKYVTAFWEKDIDGIVALLKHDAIWEMPPYVGWYQGADNIGRLIDHQCPGERHDMPMIATSANGQPAFGLYMRRPDGVFTPFHLQVLTITDGEVSHVGAFYDDALFERFGLPAVLDDAAVSALRSAR